MSRERLRPLILPVLVLAALALVPVLTGSRSIWNLLSTLLVMSVFALSFNLLLGYTGIVSLGHALFFGLGAYGVGIAMRYLGPSPGSLLLGLGAGLALSAGIGALAGYICLRVQDIYYAMITLALAELLVIAAEKWHPVTGGLDGMSLPSLLPGRAFVYYTVLLFAALMFLFGAWFLRSPAGQVLVAIRENEDRARALGFDVLRHKVLVSVVAGMMASLAGAVYALSAGFVRAGLLGVEVTLDGLLMTMIGGVGTLAGPLVGSGVLTLARDWLSDAGKLHPLLERWHILFGLLYILIVLTMPGGIVSGYTRLRARWEGRR